jgi:heme-degrading monooxygenase HmoA
MERPQKEVMMTVLMILRVKADPARLEKIARGDSSPLLTLRDRGQSRGATRHRFFATEDEVIVVDEWPSEEAFRQFLADSPEIPQLIAHAGATALPDITFARQLELGDDIG